LASSASTGRSSSLTPTVSASGCTSSLGRRDSRPALSFDAGAVHLTDPDGADILIQIEEELRARGTTLALAGVHPPVLALWERAGLIEAVGERNVFDTVDEAVRGLSNRRAEVHPESVKGARS
jgi:MFS superfamily sulfate permease-like transporter